MAVDSWVSPKTLKGRSSRIHGKGWFAATLIKQRELIGVKGGHLVTSKTVTENQAIIQHSELQIADDLFLAPLTESEFEGSMIYVNHSCEPNTQFEGSIMVTALRNIEAGEELTIEYGW